MATKLNPGKFDCYENAEDDEPMFILLARDPLAPVLTKMWAILRKAGTNGEDKEKIEEALQCAKDMNKWRKKKRPNKRIALQR